MDRSGWLAWAWTATLAGAVLAANGFVVLWQTTGVLADESRAVPPPGPWYASIAAPLAAGAAMLVALGAAPPAHAWAKTRARGRERPTPRATAPAKVEEERISAPPGFGGPAVRTRRAGAGPLLAWSAGGLLALAGGAVLATFALLTLEQTAGMDGSGLSQALLWSRLLRFAAVPLLAAGAAALAWGWGRWFPLGALEVVDEAAAGPSRPMHLKWQRHD